MINHYKKDVYYVREIYEDENCVASCIMGAGVRKLDDNHRWERIFNSYMGKCSIKYLNARTHTPIMTHPAVNQPIAVNQNFPVTKIEQLRIACPSRDKLNPNTGVGKFPELSLEETKENIIKYIRSKEKQSASEIYSEICSQIQGHGKNKYFKYVTRVTTNERFDFINGTKPDLIVNDLYDFSTEIYFNANSHEILFFTRKNNCKCSIQ